MATVAKMVVNNGNGQRGMVCQYDVVCFDKVAGVSFDQRDGVNILKGYMASGEFSRGKETKISMEFYKDPDDAVFKVLEE